MDIDSLLNMSLFYDFTVSLDLSKTILCLEGIFLRQGFVM